MTSLPLSPKQSHTNWLLRFVRRINQSSLTPLIFMFVCCFSYAAQNVALHDELLELLEKDQTAMSNNDANKQETLLAGANRLKLIIKAQGWPTISQVGKDGAQAAWLIAQHADFDGAFQKEALALMEKLAPHNEVNLDNLAYMRDRVAIASGAQQSYATQGKCNGNVWEPFPLKNPTQVDELRSSMTLTPLENYIAMASRVMCKNGGH